MRFAINQLDSFSGGGYGNKFKQVLDTGSTYEEIVLKTNNLLASQIVLVQLSLNGDPIVSVSGQDLLDIRKAWKLPAESGVFRIPFKDIKAKTDAGQQLTSLPTSIEDNLVLEVSIGAATQAQIDGGLTPELGGYYKVSGERPRVFIPRIKREVVPIGITGENNVKTIDKGPALRMVMLKDAGAIDRLRILRNSKQILDVYKDDNDIELKNLGFDTVSGYFIVNPVMSGFNVYDMMQTASSKFEVKPTVNTPGDIEALMMTLEYEKDPTIDPLTLIAKQGSAQK